MYKVFDLSFVSANERQEVYEILSKSNIDYEAIVKTGYSSNIRFGGSNSALYVKTKEEQRIGLELINKYQSSLNHREPSKKKLKQSGWITKVLITTSLLVLMLSVSFLINKT